MTQRLAVLTLILLMVALMNNSLLPANSTFLEKNLEKVIRKSFELPVVISDLHNPKTCPVDILPWLAWAMSVDEWDSNWNEEQKRQAILDSLNIHRYRGTLASIKRVLTNIGLSDSEIVEGTAAKRYDSSISHSGDYFYGGDTSEHWATYRIYLKKTINEKQAIKLRDLLKKTAPARCHLLGIHLPSATYDGSHKYDGKINYGEI